MDCFPVRIVLEISEEVLQAVLLDKIHVAIMAFTKSKKESTNIKSTVCIVLHCDIAECNIISLRSHSS
jgi:hypothetical protein